MTFYLIGAGACAAAVLLIFRFLASRPRPASYSSTLSLASESAPPADVGEFEREMLAAVSILEDKLQLRRSAAATSGVGWFDGWLERCESVRRFVDSNSSNPPSPIFGRGLGEMSFDELIDPGYELDRRIRQYLEARGL